MKEVTQTISGFIKEMVKMGVTCFPAADLAMALPAYTWDLEKANSFDYSKPSKKGVNPKTAFSATDQAMAILSSLAYMKGAEGEIKAMLFDASTMHPLLQKNAGAELAARGVKLSEASFAQLASYKSEKGKPCWFSAADEANKVVYVVIRGTDSINDILSDLNIQTADVSICGASAKVHSGKLSALRTNPSAMLFDALQTLASRFTETNEYISHSANAQSNRLLTPAFLVRHQRIRPLRPG
jgi:hypothetical protein